MQEIQKISFFVTFIVYFIIGFFGALGILVFLFFLNQQYYNIMQISPLIVQILYLINIITCFPLYFSICKTRFFNQFTVIKIIRII
ncbi:hypothetical protein IMG5_126130 [Ichthyophthirius multifiliis]|uniref:Transmembrane protein n=1 Tax=Ichthyophthirius multifiliis TaxID=5932 RepID=G0QVS8_ICHMU|nr:hypothetical protein IMG5_126130 [Ichthyophthirius multifiliis]EGR30677.1 hypothetical protein IMG5_126130 [Ichthyophthirius multifiliis]|eukprot:XP_004032264.1 hypothetical protein IMG5_126130 [Ichthyophthirius multifiliis]